MSNTTSLGLRLRRTVNTLALICSGLALFACGGGGSSKTTAPPSAVRLSLLAGGMGGSGNLDGTAGAARFGQPLAVAVDSRGNAYVADAEFHVVRKVAPDGSVSDFAGQRGFSGYTDGVGTAALLANPGHIAVDGDDNLYVSEVDQLPGIVRKITPSGVVSQMPIPGGLMTVDKVGTVYSASDQQISRWRPDGTMSVLAGAFHEPGNADGTGTQARFEWPAAIAVDALGNVYVADRNLDDHETCRCQAWEVYGSSIRKVSPDGVVTTLAGIRGLRGHVDGAGSTARFMAIRGLAIDRDGQLLVADAGDHSIRRVSADGVVSTVVGRPGLPGRTDGSAIDAQFNAPVGVTAATDGSVYVTEVNNFTLRRIATDGTVSTVAGLAPDTGSADGRGAEARFNRPLGIAGDAAGNVFVADTGNHTIRKVTPEGVTTTVAGRAGQAGLVDGPVAQALFNTPTSVAVDVDGNLYMADHDNQRVRRIGRDGMVTTLFDFKALTAFGGGNPVLSLPLSLALARDGALLVADHGQNRIHRIAPGGAIGTLAGHILSPVFREGAHDGVGQGATFAGPLGLAVGSDGLVYVADVTAVRKISPDLAVSTFVGGDYGYVDALGIAARFNGVAGVAVDASGSVLVADRGNRLVRKVTPTATVTTLVGTPGQWGVRLGATRASLGDVMAVAIVPQGVVVLSENSVLVFAP